MAEIRNPYNTVADKKRVLFFCTFIVLVVLITFFSSFVPILAQTNEKNSTKVTITKTLAPQSPVLPTIPPFPTLKPIPKAPVISITQGTSAAEIIAPLDQSIIDKSQALTTRVHFNANNIKVKINDTTTTTYTGRIGAIELLLNGKSIEVKQLKPIQKEGETSFSSSLKDLPETTEKVSIQVKIYEYYIPARWPFTNSLSRLLAESNTITVLLNQEKVLKENKVTVGGEGDIVSLEGVGEIELPEDSNRPNTDITVRQLHAPLEQNIFTESTPNDPGVTYTDTVLEIVSNTQITQPAGIRITVPADFAAAVPPNHELDVFAKITGDGETYISLDGTYNPETKVISATLPPAVWYQVANTQTTAKNTFIPIAYADSQSNSLHTRLLLGTGVSRSILNSLILLQTGRFSSISGGGESLNIQGNEHLNIEVTAQGTRVSAIRKPFNDPIPPITCLYHDLNPNCGTGHSDHTGIDYGVGTATREVIAAHDGKIKFQYSTDGRTNSLYKMPGTDTFLAGYGYNALLTHFEQGVPLYTTRYGHLALNSAKVTDNTDITKNTPLAIAGNTGNSTGPHTHFEYMIGTNRLVNPADYYEGDVASTISQDKIGLSFNGNLVPESIQSLPAGQTDFTLSIDFTKQRLTSGTSYPLDLVLIAPDGSTRVLDWAIVKVGINPLRVTLTWDKNNTDVDLRVQDSQDNLSWYRFPCGVPSGCLDRDDSDGYGPEVFTLLNAPKGEDYTVWLHYFSDNGNGPTNATVTIEVNGHKTTIVKSNLTSGQLVPIGTYTPNP